MQTTSIPPREELVKRVSELVPTLQSRAASTEEDRRLRSTSPLAMASGGSSIYSSVPIQRVVRDIQAVNLHALMNPSSNAELYGRMLCGLEPNTGYV